MVPAVSVRNLTPCSTAVGSFVEGSVGTTEGSQMLHGHARGPMVTVTPADGNPRFALSSTARLLIVALPTEPGVQV